MLPLGIPGVALVIALRLIYGTRERDIPDPLYTLLATTGRLLIATSLVGGLSFVWGAGAFVAIPLVVIVGMAALLGYFAMERRALLAILASTAERGIPLSVAIRAYIVERRGWGTRKARRLAAELEAGLPLHQALMRSRLRLPAPAMVAVQMAQGGSDLAVVLRQAVDDAEADDRILVPATEKLFLLTLATLFALCSTAFVFSLSEVFSDIYNTYEVGATPGGDVARLVALVGLNVWWLLAPAIALCLLLAFFLLPFGFRPRNVPFISRLFRPADAAGIFHLLALAVRVERPLSDVLEQLSQLHRARYFRRRLTRVSRQVAEGGDWCDALAAQRLIRRADAALLKAAARLGNLPWALEQLAAGARQRSADRLRNLTQQLTIVVVMLVGLFVFWLTASLMKILVTLTEVLA